ncbi:Ankyrin repeat-containing protein [Zea mays]|uniref:Ankyrin repeat-containing protein n=1 Tax=Zea mays TaxID=4577 RepID=A0A1D6KBA8_MAIZE|nr:Ankyrin repeat-containing protein [Zea mays]
MVRHLLLLSFPRHSSAPAAPLLQIHGAQHLERPCRCSSTGISSSTRRPGLSHHGCPSSISSLPTRLPRFHGRRRPSHLPGGRPRPCPSHSSPFGPAAASTQPLPWHTPHLQHRRPPTRSCSRPVVLVLGVD